MPDMDDLEALEFLDAALHLLTRRGVDLALTGDGPMPRPQRVSGYLQDRTWTVPRRVRFRMRAGAHVRGLRGTSASGTLLVDTSIDEADFPCGGFYVVTEIRWHLIPVPFIHMGNVPLLPRW
jgi:hypothetical protein